MIEDKNEDKILASRPTCPRGLNITALWYRLLNYLQLVAGPQRSLVPVFVFWNELPEDVVSAPLLPTFRRRLTHFCFINLTRTSLFDILLLAPLFVLVCDVCQLGRS